MSKRSNRRLAILGGEPVFEKTLHVGRPNLGDRRRFLERVDEIFDRNWLTNAGPLVAELEQRVADIAGTKHCVAMCNATIALEIVIRALELRGEVIVPAFTFPATAHALQWQEITPVFCDIDPKTHCLDPKRVEMMITPRTSGIIGVHLWGRAADAAGLEEIARAHNLSLLFDAAHALGCTYRGQSIGRFGRAEVFSFHATKLVNAFEGGAVVTNDGNLAEKLRYMKNFGFGGLDRVDHLGTNGKMTEISAAMGLTSLESMPEFIAHNRSNYEAYRNQIADIPGLELLEYDDSESSNFQYIVVEVDDSVTGLPRDDLVTALHAENVRARRYFYPGCHRMEPYKSLFPHAGLLLPETEALVRRVLILPTGTAMDGEKIGLVCGILREAIANAPAVRERCNKSNWNDAEQVSDGAARRAMSG